MAGKDKQQQKKDMKAFTWVLMAVVVLAVGSIGWSVTRNAFSAAATEPLEFVWDDLNELVAMATGIERGNADADATIMEFADFQCPACGQFQSQMKPQIDLAFVESGLARFVYHDFPLSMHPHSFLASRAGRCAHDQDADGFWPYHDQLYRTQAVWGAASSPPISAFEGYAKAQGLDLDEFSACLNSDKFADVVSANIQLGLQLGVGSTPTIFVSTGGGAAARVSNWGDIRAFQQLIVPGTPDEAGGQD